MNQNKQSGFVKWLLIIISVLFLFVMLVLPLLVVITQAFKSGCSEDRVFYIRYSKRVTSKLYLQYRVLSWQPSL